MPPYGRLAVDAIDRGRPDDEDRIFNGDGLNLIPRSMGRGLVFFGEGN